MQGSRRSRTAAAACHRRPQPLASEVERPVSSVRFAAPCLLSLGSLLGIGMGNAFELYDFLIFSFFAIQIGRTFFPSGAHSTTLLGALALFGVGFLTRPLGGIVIGTYADRAGRKAAMVLSFVLMGIATVTLAATPSYVHIGVAAPLLALAARLLQGFSLGAEAGPSTAYLLEAAPPHRRGLYVAVQSATQGLAMLACALIGFVLSSRMTSASVDAWGWRVAVLLGALLAPLGIYLRRALPEDAYGGTQAAAEQPQTAVPVRLLVVGFVMLAAMTIGTYVRSYLTTYLQDTLHLSSSIAFGAGIVSGGCALVACPSAGLLSDRVGRKKVVLTALLISAVLTVPLFLLMNRFPTALIIGGVTAILSLAGWAGNVVCLTALAESLPAPHRAAALGTLYAVAVSVSGGSTQFLVQWLIQLTGSSLAPAWYSTVALGLGALAVSALSETASASRRQSRAP